MARIFKRSSVRLSYMEQTVFEAKSVGSYRPSLGKMCDKKAKRVSRNHNETGYVRSVKYVGTHVNISDFKWDSCDNRWPLIFCANVDALTYTMTRT